MEIRRWYKTSAEPKIENGRGRISRFTGQVSRFIKGDSPTTVKVAAVGAGLILLPVFLMMTFLILATAFFAMLTVRPRKQRGLFLTRRFRRPVRDW